MVSVHKSLTGSVNTYPLLQWNSWECHQFQQALQPRPEVLLHPWPWQWHVSLWKLRRVLQLWLVVRCLHVCQPQRKVLPQEVQGCQEWDLLGNVAQHDNRVLPHQLQAGLQDRQDDDTAQKLCSLRGQANLHTRRGKFKNITPHTFSCSHSHMLT